MQKTRIARIEELGEVVGGGTPKTENPEYWNGDIPWISPSDLTGYTNVYISRGANNITELGLKKSSTKLLPKGTVLLSSRAPVGYLAIAENDICTNQGFKSIICNESINNLYLYYYLKQNTDQLKAFASGATFPELSGKSLKKIKIEVFEDIDYQKTIADIVYKYDRLIEINNKRIKLLEQTAQEIYKEWFVRFRFPGYENTRFENGLPTGWNVCRLDEIASILMGQSPESIYYNRSNDGLPFHQGVGSYGDYYLIDDVYSTEGKRIAEPNSIIFSVRAPVGRININLNKIILGRGVAAINSKTGNNHYLYWALRNRFSEEDTIGNGSIFVSVTKDELNKQKMLVPEQRLILLFDNITSTYEKEQRCLYLSNQNLIKQRDYLLPRLMSGKLEV